MTFGLTAFALLYLFGSGPALEYQFCTLFHVRTPMNTILDVIYQPLWNAEDALGLTDFRFWYAHLWEPLIRLVVVVPEVP
jgi:hypothetical protein